MVNVGSKCILDNDNDDDDDDDDEEEGDVIWRNIRLINEHWITRRRRAFAKKLVVIYKVKHSTITDTATAVTMFKRPTIRTNSEPDKYSAHSLSALRNIHF